MLGCGLSILSFYTYIFNFFTLPQVITLSRYLYYYDSLVVKVLGVSRQFTVFLIVYDECGFSPQEAVLE
jgi:hypothetical protein